MTDIPKKDAERIIGAPPELPPKIETEEQALNYLDSTLTAVTVAREACNVIVPGDKAATVRAQKKAFTRFLMNQGRAMEAAILLFRVGLITDRAYLEFRQRALNTLAASVVGQV